MYDTGAAAVKMGDLKSAIQKIVQGRVEFDEPMSAHTSLKIGGPVEIMIFPEDPVSLKNILAAAVNQHIPLFVFGGGTNLLAADERIEGIAVSLEAFRTLEHTRETDETKAAVYAGAGLPLPLLVNFARKNGYSGIEALAGIPGCVGGAVYMNAGSYGTEMKDVITSVSVMNMQGRISVLNREELEFSYRRLRLSGDAVILGAGIMLKKDRREDVERRIKETLEKKRTTQPLGELSAGCVFRNPEGGSAGRLIDEAGCKGMRAGNIEVSALHANYFINRGGGTCMDFMKLMDMVRGKVTEHSGVALEPEIKMVGVRE